MIAPIRPPKRPTRSPAVERARHLLTSALWQVAPKQSGKIPPARAWKAWLFGGVLIAVAAWLIYLAFASGL